MGKIFISGLVNIETTVKVRAFPIPYYPIDYPFFGVGSAVSGVAYNIAKALTTLGDEPCLCSLLGQDFQGEYARNALRADGIDTARVLSRLRETPASVVLYDETGKRQIYCDLKDVQESEYPFEQSLCDDADLVVACNTNFSRPLLHMVKRAGKQIATDVHVLSDIYDAYNREFLENADIVFLSDEGIGEDYWPFLRALADAYPMRVIVLGRGSKGAAMYRRETNEIKQYPAFHVGEVVNTVGAGDALFSAFIHFYVKGYACEQALALAQVFASKKITVSGASCGFITAQETETRLASIR